MLYWHVEPDSSCGLNPSMLVLSDEAQVEWIRLNNTIEKSLADGDELADIRDVASKAADNLAGVAALFEVTSNKDKPSTVGIEAMCAAGRVVYWHLHETRRYLVELSTNDEHRCAAALDKWLVGECIKTNTGETSRREVQNRGPNATRRDRAKLNEALPMSLLDIIQCKTAVAVATGGESNNSLSTVDIVATDSGG